MAPAVQTKCR